MGLSLQLDFPAYLSLSIIYGSNLCCDVKRSMAARCMETATMQLEIFSKQPSLFWSQRYKNFNKLLY